MQKYSGYGVKQLCINNICKQQNRIMQYSIIYKKRIEDLDDYKKDLETLYLPFPDAIK